METPGWLKQLGFVATCLVIPILWGWLVNALFVHWGRRRKVKSQSDEEESEVDDETFIDYQI
jgi:hypothetical protein